MDASPYIHEIIQSYFGPFGNIYDPQSPINLGLIEFKSCAVKDKAARKIFYCNDWLTKKKMEEKLNMIYFYFCIIIDS